MGGSVSSGFNNNELIWNLVEGDCIRTADVQRVFQLVDRGEYFLPNYRNNAYKDLAWKSGHYHLSAPCVYSEVMEGLCFEPGLSFLNLGSGTGYLNTMIGLLLGSNGINHGIELYADVVDYANRKLETFKRNSGALDEFDFCEPNFIVGNCLAIKAHQIRRYDRVYCGAACPETLVPYVKNLVAVGGIVVMPCDDQLLKMCRKTEDSWDTTSLLNVTFATLVAPRDGEQDVIEMFHTEPATLQQLCRSAIRAKLRHLIEKEHPELGKPLTRPPQLNRKKNSSKNRNISMQLLGPRSEQGRLYFNTLRRARNNENNREEDAGGVEENMDEEEEENGEENDEIRELERRRRYMMNNMRIRQIFDSLEDNLLNMDGDDEEGAGERDEEELPFSYGVMENVRDALMVDDLDEMRFEVDGEEEEEVMDVDGNNENLASGSEKCVENSKSQLMNVEDGKNEQKGSENVESSIIDDQKHSKNEKEQMSGNKTHSGNVEGSIVVEKEKSDNLEHPIVDNTKSSDNKPGKSSFYCDFFNLLNPVTVNGVSTKNDERKEKNDDNKRANFDSSNPEDNTLKDGLSGDELPSCSSGKYQFCASKKFKKSPPSGYDESDEESDEKGKGGGRGNVCEEGNDCRNDKDDKDGGNSKDYGKDSEKSKNYEKCKDDRIRKDGGDGKDERKGKDDGKSKDCGNSKDGGGKSRDGGNSKDGRKAKIDGNKSIDDGKSKYHGKRKDDRKSKDGRRNKDGETSKDGGNSKDGAGKSTDCGGKSKDDSKNNIDNKNQVDSKKRGDDNKEKDDTDDDNRDDNTVIVLNDSREEQNVINALDEIETVVENRLRQVIDTEKPSKRKNPRNSSSQSNSEENPLRESSSALTDLKTTYQSLKTTLNSMISSLETIGGTVPRDCQRTDSLLPAAVTSTDSNSGDSSSHSHPSPNLNRHQLKLNYAFCGNHHNHNHHQDSDTSSDGDFYLNDVDSVDYDDDEEEMEMDLEMAGDSDHEEDGEGEETAVRPLMVSSNYTGYMQTKLAELPLPAALKSYLNYHREMD